MGDPPKRAELFEAHRAVGVQLGGRDAHLGTEAELITIVEAGGSVHEHEARIDLADETLTLGLVAGHDRFGVKRAVAGDVRQRLIGTNPVIGRIEDDILKTRRRLGELKTRYTDEHSAVQAELRTLDRLEDEREALLKDAEAMKSADIDRLWNLAAGSLTQEDGKTPPLLVSQMTRLQESNAEYLRLKEETSAIEAEIDSIHTAIAETGPVMQEQKRLEEEIRMAQESHDSISKRFDNAQITGALGKFEAPERIKVIDAPVDPVVPVTPGRILFLVVGIVAGLVAGAGLAAAAEILDTRLRRQHEFEAVCEAPVVSRYCN